MKPIIAITCDTNKKGLHLFHQVGEKYIEVIQALTGGLPLLLPSMKDPIDNGDILSAVDGILFTGGYANIQRELYGLESAPDDEIEDHQRDKNTLPLIRAAVAAGVPVFGICRGFQEMNVAFGGTLHPRLHDIEGRFDHRENLDDPIEIQYGPAHKVMVSEGGVLAKITGNTSFDVNSVHGQGIDRIADSLTVEAKAEDGTIEAVSVKDSKAFALAVQWHPEWQAAQNEQSSKLFLAFGDAVMNHKLNKE